jgi:hypothetical protein
VLRENESVSPYYLARNTKLPINTIVKIMNSMVDRSMLKINFVVKCNNLDTDMIHGYEFDDEDEMLDFIRDNEKCKQCNYDILTQDIRVFYKMIPSDYVGDLYG